MSNAPGPGGQGTSRRRRPTPTSGPRGRPDAPKRRTPAAAAGVPEPASPGGGARSLGQDSRPGLRAPRPHLHLPRPPLQADSRAAGARAPRGGGAPRPGPLPPADALTWLTHRGRGRRSGARAEPHTTRAEGVTGGGERRADAATLSRGGCTTGGQPPRERGTAPAPAAELGAGSGPPRGGKAGMGAGRAWGRWGRRAPAPPGDSRGFRRCPARAPGASAGGFLGNRASWR